MTTTSPEKNKALVLEAFDTLFNKRDYVAAERFWSDRYIQHSAHIAPGRDGLFNLVRGLPDTLRYENHVILAEGDYVVLLLLGPIREHHPHMFRDLCLVLLVTVEVYSSVYN